MTSGNINSSNNKESNAQSKTPVVVEDCSICLDQMTQADVDHPLQCSTHCGFNFCRNCIESLINSSKDDYEEASDGSRQVKVHLHCPNCRSDLSASIRDTVLLRKVDDAKKAAENGDAEMTDSQRRTLEAFKTSAQVQEAVDEAKQAERAYMRASDRRRQYSKARTQEEEASRELAMKRSSLVAGSGFLSEEEKKEMDDSGYVEEWGVEVELGDGIHNSFRKPREPKRVEEKKQPVRLARIDSTLFGGLEYFMQEGEKFYVTELMTSGNVDKVAEGAELLRKINAFSRASATNGTSINNSFAKNGPNLNRKRVGRCASIFQLIEESKAAHAREDDDLKQAVKAAIAVASAKPLQSQVQDWRRTAKHRAQQPPLPVRMPKCIQIHVTSKQHGLELCDDVWDGTVMDAYSKITVAHPPFGGPAKIYKKKQDSHPGVRKVMGQVGDVQVELPGKKRVLVASLGPEAGAQGVMKGDVVTHINGAHVFDKSASEVNEFFDFLENDNTNDNEIVTVTFNAEPSVAEALKRRSFLVEPF